MNKSILITVFFLATLFASAAPKFEIIGGDTFDWGTQSSTKKVLTTKIIFQNTGNEMLKIYSVNPNCGCTTAPLDKQDIMPGDTAVLDVTLNISTYSGDVTKGIDIKSNDPDNLNKHITLKTHVIRPLTLFPNYLNFGNMSVGKDSQAQIIITNATDKPVVIEGIDIYPDDLKLNLKKGDLIPANGDFTFIATFSPKNIGRFMANVKLRTSDPDVPELIMNGFGNISEPLKQK